MHNELRVRADGNYESRKQVSSGCGDLSRGSEVGQEEEPLSARDDAVK